MSLLGTCAKTLSALTDGSRPAPPDRAPQLRHASVQQNGLDAHLPALAPALDALRGDRALERRGRVGPPAAVPPPEARAQDPAGAGAADPRHPPPPAAAH